MVLIDYKKLASKISYRVLMRYVIASSCGWCIILMFVDAIVNFNLWTFKLLLLPAFVIFIVGVLIADNLFEYELYGK
ncbi:MAG: hypothetical protein WC346_17020 [Methanogenium sp.]|jgi:hypothetical protein